MMNDYDYLRLSKIRSVDVSHMNVSKYGWDREKEGRGANYSGKKKKKNFSEIKDKIISRDEKIMRKERTLEEHMRYMIWIGHNHCKIVNI